MVTNKLSFKITKKQSNELTSGHCSIVRIFIDNKDLIDILKAVETPFALREGDGSLAGSYEGLVPEVLYENLTGTPIYEDNKTTVLECVCGCEYCWDFLVEVKEDDDRVVWTNFENNHRGRDSHNFWDYSSFYDLVFDKKEYYEELEKLKNEC